MLYQDERLDIRRGSGVSGRGWRACSTGGGGDFVRTAGRQPAGLYCGGSTVERLWPLPVTVAGQVHPCIERNAINAVKAVEKCGCEWRYAVPLSRGFRSIK